MGFLAVLMSFTLLFSSPTHASVESVEEVCEHILLPEEIIALEAAKSFHAYTSSLKNAVKEREYIVDLIELALIAREHLLILGPPGNAKSMIADLALQNILVPIGDEEKSSYYRIQMTPETSISETHGPLNYKELSETSRYMRLYEEGMLKSHFSFIDEVFDAPVKLQRNMLVMLVERLHAQGSRIEKGNIQSIIAASNKYINEVYEKAGDDSPKAYFDRYALVAFIAGELEYMDSATDLVQGLYANPISKLKYADLQAIQKLSASVTIPDDIAQFLSVLSWQIKAETENLEQSSLKKYQDGLRAGEDVEPPYRATKYMSGRTLGKSHGILQAIVARNWMASQGKRPLVVNYDDVRELVQFLSLNGPSSDFINEMLGRSTNSNERNQLQTISIEREIFEKNFNTLYNQVQAAFRAHDWTVIQTELAHAKTDEERKALAMRMVRLQINLQEQNILPPDLNNLKLADFTGEMIGHGAMFDGIHRDVEQILKAPVENFIAAAKKESEEQENQRQAIEDEKRRAEEAFIESQRQKELEELAEPTDDSSITYKDVNEKWSRDEHYLSGGIVAMQAVPSGDGMMIVDRTGEVYIGRSNSDQLEHQGKIRGVDLQAIPWIEEFVPTSESSGFIRIGNALTHFNLKQTARLQVTVDSKSNFLHLYKQTGRITVWPGQSLSIITIEPDHKTVKKWGLADFQNNSNLSIGLYTIHDILGSMDGKEAFLLAQYQSEWHILKIRLFDRVIDKVAEFTASTSDSKEPQAKFIELVSLQQAKKISFVEYGSKRRDTDVQTNNEMQISVERQMATQEQKGSFTFDRFRKSFVGARFLSDLGIHVQGDRHQSDGRIRSLRVGANAFYFSGIDGAEGKLFVFRGPNESKPAPESKPEPQPKSLKELQKDWVEDYIDLEKFKEGELLDIKANPSGDGVFALMSSGQIYQITAGGAVFDFGKSTKIKPTEIIPVSENRILLRHQDGLSLYQKQGVVPQDIWSVPGANMRPPVEVVEGGKGFILVSQNSAHFYNAEGTAIDSYFFGSSKDGIETGIEMKVVPSKNAMNEKDIDVYLLLQYPEKASLIKFNFFNRGTRPIAKIEKQKLGDLKFGPSIEGSNLLQITEVPTNGSTIFVTMVNPSDGSQTLSQIESEQSLAMPPKIKATAYDPVLKVMLIASHRGLESVDADEKDRTRHFLSSSFNITSKFDHIKQVIVSPSGWYVRAGQQTILLKRRPE